MAPALAGGLLLALALAGLVYWALGTAPAGLPQPVLDHSRPKPQGGVYTIAAEEPAHLNPFTTADLVARRGVLAYTHEALMDRAPGDGSLRPALAEDLAVQEGGRLLLFTLREGARFADGSPVTMADVLFTFGVSREPGLVAGALGQALKLVRSVRAVEGRRFAVELEAVTFTAVSTVATGYLVGQKRWFLAEVRRLAAAAGEAEPQPGSEAFGRWLAAVRMPGPGSGPYRIARWDSGRAIDLIQNENSWHRAVRPTSWNLAGLRIRFVADPAGQFAMLRRGELDLYQTAEAESLLRRYPDLAERFRAVTYSHGGLGHFVVVWNHRRAPFGAAAVRRALSRLFDRSAMAATGFGGKAVPSPSWFRPGSPNLSSEPSPAFDTAAARRELAAAGHPDLRVGLLFAAGRPEQRRMVEIAQPAFTAAGVGLDARPMEWAALVARLEARDFDAVLLYYSLSPEVDPFDRFHSSRAGGSNHAGYANPEVDRILEAARGELDPGRRAALYREFDSIFRREQPVTVLVHPQGSVLLSRRFRGVEPGPLGLYPESWWVPR